MHGPAGISGGSLTGRQVDEEKGKSNSLSREYQGKVGGPLQDVFLAGETRFWRGRVETDTVYGLPLKNGVGLLQKGQIERQKIEQLRQIVMEEAI